ncbi:response regulator [bacterium]|nr:response regulator [bacterium]
MTIYQTLQSLQTLLIDDDEWIRNAMSIVFENEGCPFTAVETAEEALVCLRRTAYDIIICDYRLPGMDGLQFFQRIGASCPGTVKVLITAYGSAELYETALTAGIHEIIEKPFSTTIIEEALQRLLSRSGPAPHPINEKGDIAGT